MSNNFTMGSNEPAVKQFASRDKQRVLSIIQNGAFFRFVEDSWLYQPSTAEVDGYHYWAETVRSGLYESALSAEAEALASIPWLRADISNRDSADLAAACRWRPFVAVFVSRISEQVPIVMNQNGRAS